MCRFIKAMQTFFLHSMVTRKNCKILFIDCNALQITKTNVTNSPTCFQVVEIYRGFCSKYLLKNTNNRNPKLIVKVVVQVTRSSINSRQRKAIFVSGQTLPFVILFLLLVLWNGYCISFCKHYNRQMPFVQPCRPV